MADTTTTQTSEGLLGLSRADYTKSALSTSAGAFASMTSALINYGDLNVQAYQMGTQASNIELQAMQQANQLREQFLNSVGTAQMSAAQRGISVGSGSLAQNIEQSSIAMNKDIQRMNTSAGLQAQSLRASASNLRSSAKMQRNIAMVKGIADLGSSAISGWTAYDMGKTGG